MPNLDEEGVLIESGLTTERCTEFRIGLVLRQTLDVLKSRLGLFLLISLVPAVPLVPLFAAQIRFVQTAMRILVSDQVSRETYETLIPVVAPLVKYFPLATLLFFALTFVVRAIIAYVTYHDLRGQDFRVNDAFRAGIRQFFQILAATFFMAVITQLGFMALIVPGLVIMTMLFVTIPVCAIEPLGPLDSLFRSVSLTKGHRWRIFGLILISFICLLILHGVEVLVAGLIFGAKTGISIADVLDVEHLKEMVTREALAAAIPSIFVVLTLVGGFGQILMSVFDGVLAATSYSILRRAAAA